MIPIAFSWARTCYLMTREAIPSHHLFREGFSDGVSLVRHEVAKIFSTVFGRRVIHVGLTEERMGERFASF